MLNIKYVQEGTETKCMKKEQNIKAMDLYILKSTL